MTNTNNTNTINKFNNLHSMAMKTMKTFFGFALLMAALIVANASSASAYDGEVWSTNYAALAKYSYNYGWNTLHVNIYDMRNNNACARVYTRGYNYFLGWGGWKEKKTACNSGISSFSENFALYSDHVEIMICDGYSYCARKRVR
jgi:Mn2+/Fe2+ NRAMP family transporter